MASYGSDEARPPTRGERDARLSHVGDSIARFLSRAGLATPFLEHRAESNLAGVVASRLGEAAAQAVSSDGVRNGELVVRVRGDALRQRLHFERAHLLEALNAAAGRQILKSIRFV